MDFIRITKRDNLSRKKEILITLLAIVLSIVFAGIILLIFGLNPFEIFKEIIMGSVGTGLRVKQTIVKAVPLIINEVLEHRCRRSDHHGSAGRQLGRS